MLMPLSFSYTHTFIFFSSRVEEIERYIPGEERERERETETEGDRERERERESERGREGERERETVRASRHSYLLFE